MNEHQVNISEEVYIFPTSFAQQRLWFIDQLVPGNYFYNVPTALRLKGSLNLLALEQTLNKIVSRHESLRTRFKIVDEQPVQVIYPSLNIALTVVDLQDLSLDKRQAEAKKIIFAESERPFNLSSEALVRSLLICIQENEHILVLNLHHIVCDDWSIGVLSKELSLIYTALCRDIKCDISTILPELPLQYADFAEWQREWLQGEVLHNQLSYWRKQLEGISTLNLPSNKLPPRRQSYRGATEFIEIPKNLTTKLESISQQEGVTLFMTLLAAFQVLLYRYSHQEDIAVGVPIANRNRSEIEGLIGFFVNSLVLRTDLSGNPSFQEVLARVREVTLGAYAHQDLPFEKLVEELQPERNISRHPLFQVMFSFQNSPMTGLDLLDLETSFINIDIKTTRFDLEFNLWECGDGYRNLLGGDRWNYAEGIRGVVVYNKDLFEQATIVRMSEHFQILLEGIVANPSAEISDLPLLSKAELNQVLVEWNNTKRTPPLSPLPVHGERGSENNIIDRQVNHQQNCCIHQLFEKQVSQTPDAIAVLFNNQQLTYRELNIRSNQVAYYLQKLGVSAEVIVGICMEPSIEMIVGILGILKAGGAYLPLDPSYPCDRIDFMLQDAQVSVLLKQSAISSQLSAINTPIVVDIDQDWKVIELESNENLTNNATGDNLAYVIYTSGSTGAPKGVAVPHKAATRLVCNTNYINIEPYDKIAQVANISFDAATFEIWGALLNGAQLVLINRNIVFSPEELALALQEKAISILFLTTALFQQISRNIPTAFKTLKYLLFGGEAVDVRWVEKILKYGSPQHLLHVYGPTENTTFSSYYLVEELDTEGKAVIPIGRPISNTQIYILDEYLQPVPIGVVGELYIGGDGLARGYLNRAELTAEKFISNPFNKNSPLSSLLPPFPLRLYKTGDLGRYLPDGNIEFIGRIDNQIKIRGFRIELGEIESVLCQHPEVREAVVVAIEDIPGEKRLVAYVVLNVEILYKTSLHYAKSTPPIPPLLRGGKLGELREFIKQKLPGYMIPSDFVVLDALPLTPNGKVDRKALPQPDCYNFNLHEDYIAPRTSVEEVLVEIWAKVLGKQQVGIHDNFFELGGHSLLATQLSSRIRDRLQVELAVRQLFETPTVASLAKYIETISWAKGLNETININQREDIEF
ncbi:MAG TPA: amino acid adenylation domain-containing protein [Oculatellaceae cyanobacterium]